MYKFNLKFPGIISLLVIIFFSCTFLIFINLFTIKILSASRAYINGESHYSKGQKDAVRHLITYLYNEDEEKWKLFKTELSVPQGDATARIALNNNDDDETIKKGFRAGRNNEKDLEDLIWLFKNFKNISFFNKAIKEWEQGDLLVNQVKSIGNEIHREIKTININPDLRKKFITRLSTISDNLTINERKFSNTLGDGTRQIKIYLAGINIFFTLIIITSVTLYYSRLIKKLTLTKKEVQEKENELHSIIKDLKKTKSNLSKEIIQQKKIIGTISHDIRSPLKYIALIGGYLKEETRKDKNSAAYKYSNSINKSATELYEFTELLIEYSNIYIEDKEYEYGCYYIYDLVNNKKEIFKEIANSNNTKIINKIDKNLSLYINNKIVSIIIHNLMDNAVKNTINGEIEVDAFQEDDKTIFKIKDTGIGMSHDLIEYYTNLFKNKESEKLILRNYGIGLHMALELLVILKGNITFSSVINQGTTVTIEMNSQKHSLINKTA